MKSKADIASRNFVIAIILFWLACAIACVFFFFGCIEWYSQYDLDHSSLMHEKLTFVNYERIATGRSGYSYEIYFAEYKTPFIIDNISSKKVDKTALGNLSPNTMVDVYFGDSSNGKYEYELCELRSQTYVPFSLEDYIAANQDNQITGMIICPIMAGAALFMVWLFIRALVPRKTNHGLGKLCMEHKIGENVIRIYHSVHVCSLVVNEKIFDQHPGVFATHFCLKGMVKSHGGIGGVVRVEAKMGAFYMCLYCNGKLVAKKFLAFG